MTLADSTRERIETFLDQDKYVLFMKGTRQQPMCGFSARVVSILDQLLPSYTTINVLDDQDIREGIKAYGEWPTIPQLYVDKDLVGGCDIVTAMFNTGELHQVVGVEKPDISAPEIHISEAAAQNIKTALEQHPELALHLSIDADWQAQFQLGPAQGHEIAVDSNGITILLDLNSAQRAAGAEIDWVETVQGEGLSIQLPQAPPPVQSLSVQEVKAELDSGNLVYLVDVRPDIERAKAAIQQAKILDKGLMEELDALPKDTPIAFICHHGNSSMGAAEHYRKQGFSNVYNVSGGINAWSLEVDPSVAQY